MWINFFPESFSVYRNLNNSNIRGLAERVEVVHITCRIERRTVNQVICGNRVPLKKSHKKIISLNKTHFSE